MTEQPTPEQASTDQPAMTPNPEPVAHADLVERRRFTLSDPQRLIRRQDVEGICPTIDSCFEYGGSARCGPCAIKQSEALGVQVDHGIPNLPEVYRLQRAGEALHAELTRLRAEIARKDEALRAYGRLLLPVAMTIAERDMCDTPLADEATLFSFMGSGASDSTTVGDFRKAEELARSALKEPN